MISTRNVMDEKHGKTPTTKSCEGSSSRTGIHVCNSCGYYQELWIEILTHQEGNITPGGFGIEGILRGAEPHLKTQSHRVHLNPCTPGCGCAGITEITGMMQLLWGF